MTRIVIIECTSDFLSLACFSNKRNHIVLEFHETIKIQNLIQEEKAWIEEVTIVIRKLLSLNKLKTLPHIILPNEVFHFKSISIPKVHDCNQETITTSHIELTLPGIQNAYFNYHILKSTNTELEVFVMLIKKNWLNLFCNALERQEIYPLSLESKVPLLITTLQKDRTILQQAILLHLESTSIFCLFINDVSYWSRLITFNEEFPICKIEDAFAYFSSKNPGFKPKKIILSGKIPNAEMIIKSLQTKFPLFHITLPPLNERVGLTLSFGLALNKVKKPNCSLNFLPPKIRSSINFKLYKFKLTASFAMLMFSFIPLAYFFYSEKDRYALEVQLLQSVLKPIESNYEKINSKLNDITLLQQAFDNFENILNAQTSWIRFLNHLQECFQKCEFAFIESLEIIQNSNTASLEKELFSYSDLAQGNSQSKILHLQGYFIPPSKSSSQDSPEQIKLLLNRICLFQTIEKVVDINIDASIDQRVQFNFLLKLNNSQENASINLNYYNE